MAGSTARTPAGRAPSPTAPRPESTAPRRYGWLTRLGDRMNARADGRAGLPSLEPGRPAGTPSLEVLAQDFLARCHRERLRLDVELAPLLESIAQLGARTAETEAAADRAARRLAAWPVLPDADQLATRRGGEVSTAVDVVAARRSREYAAERRPVVTEEAELRSSVTRQRVEMARVRSAVRAREIVGGHHRPPAARADDASHLRVRASPRPPAPGGRPDRRRPRRAAPAGPRLGDRRRGRPRSGGPGRGRRRRPGGAGSPGGRIVSARTTQPVVARAIGAAGRANAARRPEGSEEERMASWPTPGRSITGTRVGVR